MTHIIAVLFACIFAIALASEVIARPATKLSPAAYFPIVNRPSLDVPPPPPTLPPTSTPPAR